MNTRRNRRNLTPEPNILSEQEPDKRNASTNTDEQLKEGFQEQTSEIGQAPVFNIHIHVPGSNEENATKLYLPRIQPIIHVHFDELAKKLRNNTPQQEKGLREKYLQNLVIQTTPKFGSVRFHYKNNSYNMHFNKNEINNCNQKQTLRKKNSSVELESNRSNLIETMQNHNTDCFEDSENCSEETKGKTDDELSNVVISNGQPIKLKKAVVVLNDICKSSAYRSGAISDLLSYKKSKSAENSPSSLLNRIRNSGPEIKKECPFSSGAHTPDESEKPYGGSDSSYVNPFSSNSCSSSVNFEFSDERKSSRRESLASLAEGCNFSEILKKFRGKHGRYADKYLRKPNISAEAQTVMEDDDKGLIDDNVWFTQNSLQTKKEASWIDQLYETEGKKQKEQEDNKDRVNLQDETSIDGIVSHENENQPSPNSYEVKIRHDTETSKLNFSSCPSVEENRSGFDPVNRDCGIECSVNQFHVAEIEPDNYEITTGNKLSSVVEEIKIVDFDLSNDTSDVVIKSESVLLETNDLILPDNKDEYFDLKLIKKEMVSPKKGTDKTIQYEKRKSRDVSENKSSPKKTKQSPGTPKKSVTKAPAMSSRDEGYIPLNIPGPTEFSVAPLSSLQACKAHDAKNFKNNMLFGERINRFSKPDHLRMYKLKKQAAGRKVYKETS